MPALRERAEDIPALMKHVLEKLASDFGEGKSGLSKEALAALQDYAFPGNVRELENILERALTLCEGNTIEAADLRLPSNEKAGPLQPPSGHALDSYLHDMERQRILAALEKTRWNKTAAAKLLGISFRALRYRLEKLGLA